MGFGSLQHPELAGRERGHDKEHQHPRLLHHRHVADGPRSHISTHVPAATAQHGRRNRDWRAGACRACRSIKEVRKRDVELQWMGRMGLEAGHWKSLQIDIKARSWTQEGVQHWFKGENMNSWTRRIVLPSVHPPVATVYSEQSFGFHTRTIWVPS